MVSGSDEHDIEFATGGIKGGGTVNVHEWDAEQMRATNAPQADQFIRREYRKGWTL